MTIKKTRNEKKKKKKKKKKTKKKKQLFGYLLKPCIFYKILRVPFPNFGGFKYVVEKN
jgi:hypothetical protein